MILSEEFNDLTKDYIISKGWMHPGNVIYDYQIAGQGNMNFVVRVFGSKGNIILKQSKPYVQKYKHVPAPIERIQIEKRFYDTIQRDPILPIFSPKVIGYDADNYVLALEDLGFVSDFTHMYQSADTQSINDLIPFIDYLLRLHGLEVVNFPSNEEMKELNHEHIFKYPFLADNGLDLDLITNGLQKVALDIKENVKLKENISALGERYLKTGTSLLHGDFYPGSWIKTHTALKVIDVEFAYMGDREFDLGVMVAHFKFAKLHQSDIEVLLDKYFMKKPCDIQLVKKYASIEILRRLIGLAQLPLKLNLKQKIELIDEAQSILV